MGTLTRETWSLRKPDGQEVTPGKAELHGRSVHEYAQRISHVLSGTWGAVCRQGGAKYTYLYEGGERVQVTRENETGQRSVLPADPAQESLF